MFLRVKKRFKDGKQHRYWSIVENRRCQGGRVVQRQVLYLGEINDEQQASWCKAISVFKADQQCYEQMAVFPDDKEIPDLNEEVIRVKLNELRLYRPRQWGACWLALSLWELLSLDDFWSVRLKPSRQGTRWLAVLKTLVVYHLIAPGSEWRLHRQWYDQSAMGD